MDRPIPVHLAVEGLVDEAVLRKVISRSGRPFAIPQYCLGKKGKHYLKTRILEFNRAANHVPFIVLADLDASECAPLEISNWLGAEPMNRNLLLRIAVREVESWILAHREGFADFFRVPRNTVPRDPDSLDDAKGHLVNLVKLKSRRRAVRDDIVPSPSSSALVGRNYAGCINGFVRDAWDPYAARTNSPSLERAVKAIEEFTPVLPGDPLQ